MRGIIVASGKELASHIVVADSFFLRLKGLLGKASLPPGEGLWINPCNSVHTFFMRFPIDLVFLDNEQCVVSKVSCIPPYRVTKIYRGATSVLELPAGTLSGVPLAVGEQVEIA